MNQYYYKIIIFIDGSCMPNPGPAGIGIVICDQDLKILEEKSYYLGNLTVPKAEYAAVIKGLEITKRKWTCRKVICYSDNEVVIQQTNKIFKVKEPTLDPYFLKIRKLIDNYFKEGVELKHIKKFQNLKYTNLHKQSDKLAKEAAKTQTPALSLEYLLK